MPLLREETLKLFKMPKGFFEVYQDLADSMEISFSPVIKGNVPRDQQELYVDAKGTLFILKEFYLGKRADKDTFQKYYDRLLALCQAGLVGSLAQPELARKALDQLKADVTNRESGKVKNHHIRELGKSAMLFGLPALAIGIILVLLFQSGILSGSPNCIVVGNFLILWSGTMIGVWLSFLITRKSLSFEELVIIEEDRLTPKIRLLFTGLLAVIIGLLLWRDAIVIDFGKFSTTQISTDSLSAFLIGAILGLNEKIIGNTLIRKTSEVLKK